ncbi:MauE/DoxX family redox-associated membrane protein [Actinomyces qiguomingii]|uniref:MauE/DoxX family redox-associated membrane protein n=1 Tax=Actinomyces qiguomingii TaxID=2057800 RepID=UPI001304DB05|nr:MauE/DoxX family redox-associated membrane protein [Actinomyces qiguomingii]
MAWAFGVVRILAGAILIAAAQGKHRQTFAKNVSVVEGYRLAPRSVAVVVAVTLPATELVLGTALVLGMWPRVVSWTGAAFYLILAAAVAQAVTRRLANECGCFGALRQSTVNWAIAGRNLTIAVLLAAATAWPGEPRLALAGNDFSLMAATPLALIATWWIGESIGQARRTLHTRPAGTEHEASTPH